PGVPGTRLPGAAPVCRHPPPLPLVGDDRRRRGPDAPVGVAEALQRVGRRGPGPDRRPGAPDARGPAAPAPAGLRPRLRVRRADGRGVRPARTHGTHPAGLHRVAPGAHGAGHGRARPGPRQAPRRVTTPGPYRPAGSLAGDGWEVLLTPERAGWTYS